MIGQDQSGSFTLEASLTFPVLMLALLALLSFSFMLYNRSDLYAVAAAVADRSASNWDNSAKDLITGAFPIGQYDKLYWRTGSDSISDAFGFLVKNDSSRLSVPVSSLEPEEYPANPQGKLRKAAALLPGMVEGGLSYSNRLYSRQVEVAVDRKSRLPSLTKGWFLPSTDVSVRAVVTEPVELIRTIDFVTTLAGRFKDMLSHRESPIPLPTETDEPPSAEVQLKSEKEAAEFLRSLLGSPAPVFVTTASGQQRKLDALDPDGLFHEAKFGYTSKTESIEHQIAKDLELIQTAGQVRGVVWHFFRDSRNGKLGPSKPLRKELEKRGIIVVIHS
ncbi:MAG: hypothetical protein K0R67_72 [Paenibacillus sp.]|nr:hypothetical protein [Paenibacillus sp.]